MHRCSLILDVTSFCLAGCKARPRVYGLSICAFITRHPRINAMDGCGWLQERVWCGYATVIGLQASLRAGLRAAPPASMVASSLANLSL